MQSHINGETKGLCVFEGTDFFMTSGEDN